MDQTFSPSSQVTRLRSLFVLKKAKKKRVQVYKGVCIKIQGSGLGKSFTVRKISSGVGVENISIF